VNNKLYENYITDVETSTETIQVRKGVEGREGEERAGDGRKKGEGRAEGRCNGGNGENRVNEIICECE
jgi:hypothetical protein